MRACREQRGRMFCGSGRVGRPRRAAQGTLGCRTSGTSLAVCANSSRSFHCLTPINQLCIAPARRSSNNELLIMATRAMAILNRPATRSVTVAAATREAVLTFVLKLIRNITPTHVNIVCRQTYIPTRMCRFIYTRGNVFINTAVRLRRVKTRWMERRGEYFGKRSRERRGSVELDSFMCFSKLNPFPTMFRVMTVRYNKRLRKKVKRSAATTSSFLRLLLV